MKYAIQLYGSDIVVKPYFSQGHVIWANSLLVIKKY